MMKHGSWTCAKLETHPPQSATRGEGPGSWLPGLLRTLWMNSFQKNITLKLHSKPSKNHALMTCADRL